MSLRHYLWIAAAVLLVLAIVAFVILVRSEHWSPGHLRTLNRIDIYDNAVRDALPQTAGHDIILDHFTRKRDDGKTPKCLIVGYDGARAEALMEILPSQSGIQALANEGGKVYHMYTGGNRGVRQFTDTAPGWAALLTGRWAKGAGGNGVTANGVNKPAGTPPIAMIELLEKNLAAKSSFVVSWNGHFVDDHATYKYDVLHAQANNLNAAWVTLENDEQVIAHTIEELSNENGADIVMVVLEHCDSAGHNSGFGIHIPEYVQAFQASDHAALEFIEALKARPGYDSEDWLIILTSDHGGIGRGHGSQRAVCRQVFFASNQAF